MVWTSADVCNLRAKRALSIIIAADSRCLFSHVYEHIFHWSKDLTTWWFKQNSIRSNRVRYASPRSSFLTHKSHHQDRESSMEISYWHHLIMYISSRQKKKSTDSHFYGNNAGQLHPLNPFCRSHPKMDYIFPKIGQTKTYYEHKAIETFLGLL